MELILALRLSDASTSFLAVWDGWSIITATPAPLFEGIFVTFSFLVPPPSISWFSFFSFEAPLSKDTSTSKGGTKNFLPHKPSFLRTNYMRQSEAWFYVSKDFNFLPSISHHKFTLKCFTIFVMNMPYGRTKSSFNEQAFICRKIIYPILIFLFFRMLSTKNASRKASSRYPPLRIKM